MCIISLKSSNILFDEARKQAESTENFWTPWETKNKLGVIWPKDKVFLGLPWVHLFLVDRLPPWDPEDPVNTFN